MGVRNRLQHFMKEIQRNILKNSRPLIRFAKEVIDLGKKSGVIVMCFESEFGRIATNFENKV